MFLVSIDNYKKISGKYKKGEKNGKGTEYILNTNILIFEGEYLNGKRHGKGKEYYFDDSGYNDKVKFEGEFVNGKRRGGKEYDYSYYDNLEKYYNDIFQKKEEKEKELEKQKKENEKDFCFIIWYIINIS